MSPRQEVFEAIPLNGNAMSDASKPLLIAVSNGSAAAEDADQVDFDDGNHEESAGFSRYKRSALFLGMIVGVFIQFSTLGANALFIQIRRETTQQDLVSFSLLWSLASSAMALLLLAFIRKTVSTVYTMSLNDSSSSSRNKECVVEELSLQLESRFVVGALIVVCVGWTVTDLLLGAQDQIIYSAATLAFSLIWCKVVISCLRSKQEEQDTAYDSAQHEPELIAIIV
jgi:hypothetical protein